jgi:hypothetical protein
MLRFCAPGLSVHRWFARSGGCCAVDLGFLGKRKIRRERKRLKIFQMERFRLVNKASHVLSLLQLQYPPSKQRQTNLGKAKRATEVSWTKLCVLF